MRYRSILPVLIALAQGAHAQSIIYSPVAASSPDMVVVYETFDFVHLLDHSGLETELISGVTPWAQYGEDGVCGTVHGTESQGKEFFGMSSVNLVHLVLDMGFEGPWDRMAIYNEETAGLGHDPVVLAHGPSVDGPWEELCQLVLTQEPEVPYGPDIATFGAPVTARYFRITCSGSTWISQDQYVFGVGEIFLGTSGVQSPLGPCVQGCMSTAVRPTPAGRFTALVDPVSAMVSVQGLTGRQGIIGYDLLGHVMGAGTGSLDISAWPDGSYVVQENSTNGPVTVRFVKAAWR